MASSPPSGLSNLGEYLVVRSLGEGTFGKVKLAVHTLSGQKVALKHINKGSINAYKVRMRVKREIEYLKLLQHPHIIKLYEVIDTPREVIMVMEYAGGELFNYIVDNGRLTESAARKFFQQIAYCLAYSHAHRIVHRDIKPENVLLDENLNVKLADFGLANEARDGDWLSTSCGSPNYAAPEVISGQLYAGPEIDVWSLGVILYVMVCGRLPFEDEHVPTLFQKISSGHFHKPSYLSLEVSHLIDRMLQTNPLKRFTIPEVLAHPWVSRDTPTYLRDIYDQQPLAPSTIDSLSSLVLSTKDPSASASVLSSSSSSSNDDDGLPEFYPGIGKLDPKVFSDLQAALGVDPSIVSSALAAFEDNCVKVAYQLFADRKGDRSLMSIQEQDDSVSPSARPIAMSRNRGPGDYGSPMSPHSTEDETEDDEDEDDEFDESINWNSAHDIRLLDTSIVQGGGGGMGEGNGPLPLFLPADHHLASYANMRNASKGRGSPARSITPSSKPRSYHWRHNAHASSSSHPHSNSNSHSPAAVASLPHQKQHRHHHHHQHKASKWHFGIRSSSPPMEVMLELYRTLEALGLEWREKKGIWAATAAASSFSESEDLMGESVSSTAAVAGSAVPPLRSRSRSMEESNASDSYDQQTRDDLDIYYIECRWRMQNVVLLLDLQLYQVDPMNYLVDFRDLGYYLAYTSDPDDPDRFEPADYPYVPRDRKEGDHQNPLIFLDCACHLIIELAGGSG